MKIGKRAAVSLLLLVTAFSAQAGAVVCRKDVNGDKVCSDGSRTRTNVLGEEVENGK